MRVEFDARGGAEVQVTAKPDWTRWKAEITVENATGSVTVTLDDDTAIELARSILRELREGSE